MEGRRPTWPWPPGAPSCGRKHRFTVNRQIWKLQPPPHHHSDSIHLQTYRGQPSNGLLVATADVSVRLKDNFLFVTEDFLLLRWSSAQLSYGAATTHEINYNFIWWTQGWFGLAGAGWMGGDRCGRRLIPTVPASSPAWKPQTSNSG